MDSFTRNWFNRDWQRYKTATQQEEDALKQFKKAKEKATRIAIELLSIAADRGEQINEYKKEWERAKKTKRNKNWKKWCSRTAVQDKHYEIFKITSEKTFWRYQQYFLNKKEWINWWKQQEILPPGSVLSAYNCWVEHKKGLLV